MTKKIDIIIPAYKAHNTIIRTLGSIMQQSILEQVKVTIVNDCDGIGYGHIINNFAPFMDIQELTLEQNGGSGVARQFGIDNTDCEYFTCIDADDTLAGAFSLELLLSKLEGDYSYHTCIGAFAEEHPPLQFLNHQNDLVWMFGKLYRRSFINQYGVRFNETRWNEDNGFNTFLRLVSSETEKIMFIPDIVYYWHFKEDSITRINNAEYSYNQSFIGYTDNMIYAIEEARKKKPFNTYIDMWAIQVMAQLYIYYLQTEKRDARFKEQNYTCCVKYYNCIFKDIEKRIPIEHSESIFAETMSEQAPNMRDITPRLTIYQFIDELSQIPFE